MNYACIITLSENYSTLYSGFTKDMSRCDQVNSMTWRILKDSPFENTLKYRCFTFYHYINSFLISS